MEQDPNEHRYDGFFRGTFVGCIAGIIISFAFSYPIAIPAFLFLGMLAGAVYDFIRRHRGQ